MPLFRRVVIVLLVLAAVATLWRMRAKKTAAAVSAVSTPPALPVATPPPPSVAVASAKTDSGLPKTATPDDPVSGLERITTADLLNAPSSDIHHDLTILVTLFEDWRSFFPGDGNPWGDNAEITAKLMGKNRRKMVFIDRSHRALNADGELCDRWGTPFRFHALSGDRMEFRSAGPDKIFGTADDVVSTPP
jgi:hypothetical protein